MVGKTIAVWFSCGAASAVAAKLTIDKYGKDNTILIVNNPVAEEHSDNLRFLKDIEDWLGLDIIEAKSKEYPSASIVDVFNKRNYMSGNKGAPCTMILKKQARYEFELNNNIDYHVLGFTVEEQARHDKFVKFERDNLLPILIDAGLTKEDCFHILLDSNIKIPEIYELGFPNANCIGCVKSQSPTYWNLVREKFPIIFKERAEQSKKIGCKLVKLHAKYLPWAVKRGDFFYDSNTDEQLSTINSKGRINHSIRVYLDDLPEGLSTGKIKSWDCGIFCNIDQKE